MIQHISVVTFAVRDMVRSDFYKKLGFEVLQRRRKCGVQQSESRPSLRQPGREWGYHHRWWGRAIFRVDHVDVYLPGTAGTRTKT